MALYGAHRSEELAPEQLAAAKPWFIAWGAIFFGKLAAQAALLIGSFFLSWFSMRTGTVVFFGIEIASRYARFVIERVLSEIAGTEKPGLGRVVVITGILAGLCLSYVVSW